MTAARHSHGLGRERKRHSCLWRLRSQQGCDSLFRAHLDHGSQRSSYPLKCGKPGSNQYGAHKPAIRRRIARIVSTVPMGRMGEPDEVAKAALYLASDDSSFVTGVELFVDGGRAQI